ncbi:four helix bundle protein [Prevotella sp. tc2-28]|uniref:four helix bundle protein n=1 Tax=Prevotella sp. tc2-28 TaxID=1761888 RepID=UPI0008943A74|nr:four helix bundle protein [Prevotella sp. tc2-28]SDZ90475.1 four helix bundle protein [Prevotella sp. tc2-28]
MDKNDLQERMINFAVRIIKMVDSMPNSISGTAIARQIVRSGTSPSANYRAACIAKSDKDFVNKLKMVEEELDETSHWLTLIMRSEMMKPSRIQPLHQECCELLSIIVKSIVTTKNRMKTEEMEKQRK